MSLALRPMSTAEVLDRTFNLYRNHFFLFTGIATGHVLCLLIGILILSLAGMLPGITSSGFSNILSILTAELVLGFLALVGYALAAGATIHAVSQVHLGTTATVRNSYRIVQPFIFRFIRIVFSIFLRVVGASLLTQILVGVGVGVLIPVMTRSIDVQVSVALQVIIVGIPIIAILAGLVWAVRIGCKYALAVPASLLEKLPARAALKRSRWLTKKSLGRIFMVFLLTGTLGFVLLYALVLPGIFLVRVFPSAVVVVWELVATFVAFDLTFPITTIAVSLLYYDLRVRKEAFDLQLMMEAVDRPLQAETTAAAPGM